MSPKKFKTIREHVGLTQTDLSRLLGLSGKMPISHFETGFRTPSPLINALMSYLASLSERRSREFIEEFQRHIDNVQVAKKAGNRG